MNSFYQSALDIAEQKLFRDPRPTRLASPRLGTGGTFVDIFLWDTVFSTFWARYHADRFPVAESLDNFYRCQTLEGFISRQIRPDGISKWSPESTLGFAPPLLAWAELEIAPFIPGRLEKVFEPLLRQHRFNTTHFRRADGLFFTDCWGSGMDNLPRWDTPDEVTRSGGTPLSREMLTATTPEADAFFLWLESQTEMPFYWNRQLGWCDTSCQMAFNALNLARIADRIDRPEEAEKLRAEHAEIAAAVNEQCFNPQTHFYADRLGDHPLNRRTICGFWPLISEVATPERAAEIIRFLRDPATFGRPCGIPTLPADDPDYLPESGYARGPVWAHTNYMVLKGLLKYGEEKLAGELAARLYHAAETLWKITGTIWENYSPEQCRRPPERSCRDFCGWSALIPITFYREFLR